MTLVDCFENSHFFKCNRTKTAKKTENQFDVHRLLGQLVPQHDVDCSPKVDETKISEQLENCMTYYEEYVNCCC
jgi:hypothetical protein